MINYNKFVFAQQKQVLTVEKDSLIGDVANLFVLVTESGVEVPVSQQTFEQCLAVWGVPTRPIEKEVNDLSVEEGVE